LQKYYYININVVLHYINIYMMLKEIKAVAGYNIWLIILNLTIKNIK